MPALKGGEGGIRTHGPVSRTPLLQSGAFDHSATSPNALTCILYILFYFSNRKGAAALRPTPRTNRDYSIGTGPRFPIPWVWRGPEKMIGRSGSASLRQARTRPSWVTTPDGSAGPPSMRTTAETPEGTLRTAGPKPYTAEVNAIFFLLQSSPKKHSSTK